MFSRSLKSFANCLMQRSMLDEIVPASCIDARRVRLVHEGGDGLSGLAVDGYGDHLVAQLYDAQALANESAIVSALGALGFRGVYVKHHPKQASTLVDTRRDDIAEKHVSVGEDAPADYFDIHENGIAFDVRLAEGTVFNGALSQSTKQSRAHHGDGTGQARAQSLRIHSRLYCVARSVGAPHRR